MIIILYFRFWHQKVKKTPKEPQESRGQNKRNKFYILDEAKYNHKNFGILPSSHYKRASFFERALSL